MIAIAIAIDTGIWFLSIYSELKIIRNIFKMFGIKLQLPDFKRMAGGLAAAIA